MSQKIINTLLEAVQDEENNPFPHFALAKEYQKINDRESAGKHYQHLVQHFPDYGGTYYHYAIFLIEGNDADEALNIIEKGLNFLQQSGETNLYNELAALRNEVFDL